MAALLRSDRIRKELAGREETENRREDFGEGIYTAEFSRRTYDLYWSLHPVVTGGKNRGGRRLLHAKSRPRPFRDTARHLGIPLLILHVHCAEATARLRLDRRQAAAGTPRKGAGNSSSLRPRPSSPLPNTTIIRVDTAPNVDYNAQLIFCEFIERMGLE